MRTFTFYKDPKLISLIGAVVVILPLTNIIYDRLESYNKPTVRPVAVEVMPATDQRKSIVQNTNTAANLPKKKEPSLEKISIKADQPASKQKKNNVKDTLSLFASVQKKPEPEALENKPKNLDVAVGDNPTGDIVLPNLILEVDLSETFIHMLTTNNLAKIIVNGTHYFDVKDSSLWSGKFIALTQSSLDTLSDRNIPLTEKLITNKLDTRYQLTMFTNNFKKSSYELRLTRSLNHKIVEMQRTAQEESSTKLKDTVFTLRFNNGLVELKLKKPLILTNS